MLQPFLSDGGDSLGLLRAVAGAASFRERFRFRGPLAVIGSSRSRALAQASDESFHAPSADEPEVFLEVGPGLIKDASWQKLGGGRWKKDDTHSCSGGSSTQVVCPTSSTLCTRAPLSLALHR